MNTIAATAISFGVYAIVEALWLWLAHTFYAAQFARFALDGELKIRCIAAAIIVYPVLLAAFWFLVLADKENATLLRGAVFGAVVYGVYNLTNKATLPGYGWAMVMVDTAWGATVFGLVAYIYSVLV